MTETKTYGAGFNPKYLEKLSERQRKFAETAVGVKFVKEFVFKKGNHLFIVGNTGSGKTQKGYWVVDWLKHTENIIWVSTGKSDEILPLLSMGKKVRIIIPKGSEFDVDTSTTQYENPEIVEVGSPFEAWSAVHEPEYDDTRHKQYNWINIFEFRETITDKDKIRTRWMSDLFETLAERTRAKTMPPIFPCSIFIDEAQWLLAGRRVTMDKGRLKNSGSIIENVLELWENFIIKYILLPDE